MPINTALVQIGGAAMATAAAYVGLATALPDANGSNATTHTRVAAGLTSTAGNITGTTKAFTGGAPNGPVQYLTYWSAQTGGTYYGYAQLTGDQASNSAGAYTVNAITLAGTAS